MYKVEHSSRRAGDLTISTSNPAADGAVSKVNGGNVF
jgi:hypothetical protein